MDFSTRSTWRGEGRPARRMKMCRVAFWPSVMEFHQQGQVSRENCKLFSDSDARVEKRSRGDQCGSAEWFQPPPHSVMQEPDFVNTWEAQSRALLLAQSLTSPYLASHFDAIFFEKFIHDRRHPVPKSDLIELGICTKTEDAPYPEYEVTQDDDEQISGPDAPDGSPCCDRPDPTAPQNVPDPPGFPDGEQNRHERDRDQRLPLHEFPEWTTTLWNALQQEGVVDTPEEGPIIRLESFYISHRYHWQEENSRVVRLNQDYEQWMREIVETWNDLFDRRRGCNILVVEPEPPTPIERGTVGTLLVVQHFDPQYAAVLTTAISDALQNPWMRSIALSIEIQSNYHQVLQRANVRQQCLEVQRQGFGACTLKMGEYYFPRDRPFRLQDGFGLVIEIPMVVTDDMWRRVIQPLFQDAEEAHRRLENGRQAETDQVNMMARRPQPRRPSSSTSTSMEESTSESTMSSSSNDDWRRTAIFTLTGQAQSALLPWRDGDELYERVAAAFNMHASEIQALHFVSFRPADLQQQQLQCMLLQSSQDQRPAQFMQLILLDLEILEENDVLPGAFRRQAKWIPKRVNRVTLFRLLALENLFQRSPSRCQVWLNNQWVSPSRQQPLQFEDGDYLEVYIGDDDRRQRCFPFHANDATSLLQSSLKHQWRVSDSHQTSRTSLDDCIIRQGQRARRRNRHRGDDEVDPEHQRRRALWQRPNLQARGLNNEPVMLFTTWFLSALNFPRCSTPRQVALSAAVENWENQLIQVWRERHHPHWPVKIIHVYPDPPGTSHGGHLIVLQHEHPGESAVLLTSHRGRHQNTFAQLIPRRITFERLWWFLDQEQVCPQPGIECRGFHGTRQLSHHTEWESENGQHLELYISEVEDDYMQLMQTDAVASASVPNAHYTDHANEQPEPPQACATTVWDTTAPPFVPHQPSIYEQDETIQELHNVWRTAAFSWDGEERSAKIAVWFVDHTWPWPHGRDYRTTQLFEDFTSWRDKLLQTWADQWQPDATIEISVVHPHPPAANNEVSGHVIIIQNPREDWVTSLVSLVSEDGIDADPMMQMAVTTHEHILLENILLVLEIYGQCVGHMGRVPPFLCRGRYDQIEIQLGQRLQGRSGYGITVHVRPNPMRLVNRPVAQEARNEGPALLQIAKTRWSAPLREVHEVEEVCERLTTDTVAHGQWPQTQIEVNLVDGNETINRDSHDGTFDDGYTEQLAWLEPTPITNSWTEEFLRAMGALHAVQDDDPEPHEPEVNQEPNRLVWIQDLVPIWQQNARPGPGGTVPYARVETWYTDHLRMQDCFQSRIVILEADPTTWHQDMLRAWSDVVIPQFEVDIHLVYPTTADMAQGTIAQLVLVQRPDQFQKSIVITIADTALQRGMPRSRAVVAIDRVSLHSALLITGLLYECPPEHLQHRCHLWFEGQEITGEQFHLARHGDAFLLHVLREEDLPALAHLTYSDEQIQIGLQTLLNVPRPSGVAYGPDWFNSLEKAFETGAAVEMREEGHVAYVLTWFVDAGRGSFCQHPRVVRLNEDKRQWRPEILGRWQFELAPNSPAELHFVDPEPPKTPWENHVAHVIITQRAEPDHAAVIISAMSWEDFPGVHQNLHYIHNMVSMQDIIARHAPEHCRGRACRVRRGNLFFEHAGRSRIGNGDSIEIDIMPPTHNDEDNMNLLQIKADRQRNSQFPVTISLEASIPARPEEIKENHFFPEVLVTEATEDCDFLKADVLRFQALPLSLHLTAQSLHVLQEPAEYCEPVLAGKVVFYVDGAAKSNRSAWSVVAVSYDPEGVPALMGVLADVVVCDQKSKQWIGATHHDNIAAELTASIAAHISAMAIEGTADTVIRPDLKLSAMVSSSSWTCSPSSETFSSGKMAWRSVPATRRCGH